MNNARTTWPVFLVGCHRSGTTLVRYLLDAHPRIACPAETKFICGLYELIHYPQLLPGLLSLRLDGREIFAECGAFAKRILDRYTLKKKKARWVDKTPNYYKILPFINDIFDSKVLFVFIVRHPLDSIISMDEKFGYVLPAQGDREIHEAIARYGIGLYCWARYWTEVNEILRVFAAMTKDRAYTFRYEDLVGDPERIIKNVLEFIGEDFYPHIIADAFASPHDRGYQDTKILSTEGIHAKSIGRWKAWRTEEIESIWPIVSDLAERYGYAANNVMPEPARISI